MGWKGPRSNPQVHSANPYQTLSRWMSWTISCKRNCLLRTLHIYQIFSLSSDLCHNQQPTSKAEFSYDAGLLENLFFFFISLLSSPCCRLYDLEVVVVVVIIKTCSCILQSLIVSLSCRRCRRYRGTFVVIIVCRYALVVFLFFVSSFQYLFVVVMFDTLSSSSSQWNCLFRRCEVVVNSYITFL